MYVATPISGSAVASTTEWVAVLYRDRPRKFCKFVHKSKQALSGNMDVSGCRKIAG